MIHGLADVCSDDALWLVISVCEYVKETGDAALFDEVVPFADEGEATVYEHLKRALDFSAEQVGTTGICQGTPGGLERLPEPRRRRERHGLFPAPLGAARLCGSRGAPGPRPAMRAGTARWPRRVKAACERELWDGEWYIRGITAKGSADRHARKRRRPDFHREQYLGGGVGCGRRRSAPGSAMDAVDRHLYSPYGIHLLWPAFSKPNDDIGFVTRVYKGIKENASDLQPS